MSEGLEKRGRLSRAQNQAFVIQNKAQWAEKRAVDTGCEKDIIEAEWCRDGAQWAERQQKAVADE